MVVIMMLMPRLLAVSTRKPANSGNDNADGCPMLSTEVRMLTLTPLLSAVVMTMLTNGGDDKANDRATP
jgi:hypothetical protein